jgi:hypothetical protein
LKKASEYRQHALECQDMLRSAATPEQQVLIQNMAETWESLARDRERRIALSERLASLEGISRSENADR